MLATRRSGGGPVPLEELKEFYRIDRNQLPNDGQPLTYRSPIRNDSCQRNTRESVQVFGDFAVLPIPMIERGVSFAFSPRIAFPQKLETGSRASLESTYRRRFQKSD